MSTPPPAAFLTSAAENSKDPRDRTLVIRQFTPDIITFSVPFNRAGVFPLGGRSTAIRLPSSELFVYVSTPHTPATAETLGRMGGEVGYLVTPDGEHAMYIEEFTKAYPKAKAIGVAPLKDKKPGVKWAGLFGAGGEHESYGFEPHITLHQVTAHRNHELVAIHHPSGTLLEGDMLFNLPAYDQYSRAGGLPALSKLFGGGSAMSPDGFVHATAMAGIVRDRTLLRREMEPIMKADWDRIVPCHGDVIDTGGKVAWGKVWAKYA